MPLRWCALKTSSQLLDLYVKSVSKYDEWLYLTLSIHATVSYVLLVHLSVCYVRLGDIDIEMHERWFVFIHSGKCVYYLTDFIQLHDVLFMVTLFSKRYKSCLRGSKCSGHTLCCGVWQQSNATTQVHSCNE